ncbi:altronate hydrolase [Arenicella chitinivorans]|uniref:Altronate hydrolase n=1 Tax=Arenicella chitinivorans TaxID=1329800 RepID=A0A918RIJ1_9GAMM|nr:altronate dehydratase family protein [Arenicella chitinivorans]GGZ97591.1 altronate hydrolase [Arenicella chitinivorans]
MSALQVHANDNVGVALTDLDAATQVLGVTLRHAIPKGHKFALRAIARNEAVTKYGHPIGIATQAVAVGEHVHSHNLTTGLRSGDQYHYAPLAAPELARDPNNTFEGYLRANGQAGTRNEIWVLNTVGCVNATAARVARACEASASVEGIHAFSHPFGCSQLGDDLDYTRKIISALAAHPNAGGVVIIGLGCENNQLSRLLEDIDPIFHERIRSFTAQEVEDEEASGMRSIHDLMEIMSQDKRTTLPASKLALGMKCGGSDAFSGLTANPLVGLMTDRVTALDGRAILTEVPEMFGAEQLLMNRAENAEVYAQTVELINQFKDYFTAHNQPVSENPSPGNIAGGITTLEEKSLGAIQKGGSAVVRDVIDYGERATQSGLTLLQAPGNDAVSSTALTAAGANLILFTTGRGTPLGFPVPTIKIASNSGLAERKPRWIDFNAGAILDGTPLPDVADQLWQTILDIASGKPACNERNDYREIAIWKTGVTL